MGALSINGIAALKELFELLVPDTLHVRLNELHGHGFEEDSRSSSPRSCSTTSRR